MNPGEHLSFYPDGSSARQPAVAANQETAVAGSGSEYELSGRAWASQDSDWGGHWSQRDSWRYSSSNVSSWSSGWHGTGWERQGQWFETPQCWIWGSDLDSAVKCAVDRGWIRVDRAFCAWWSSQSCGAGRNGFHVGSQATSEPAGDPDGCDGGSRSHERSGHAEEEEAPQLLTPSRPSSSTGVACSQASKPNRGKDFIPVHDGLVGMREYERRVRLFQNTTAIDPEFQGGRLVEKLQGAAWDAVECLDLKSLQCPEGVQVLFRPFVA